MDKRLQALQKRLARLSAKRDSLTARGLASEDINEVRSINEHLADLNAEIEETNDEIAAIEEERAAANEAHETRESIPSNAQLVNGNVVAGFGQTNAMTQTRENTDPFATMEYRKAFMRYVQTGQVIPSELSQRDGLAANTTQLGATIPTTVLNEFINEIRLVYGNLYSKVRKLNIPGAVKVPIAELQATFKWITEDTVAPREDGGEINQYVMFEYNMAEIRISQTLLSSIVTIDLFEREIVKVMLTAYLRAMDLGIVRGTGNGQMLGILNDPRVTTQSGHAIDMTEDDMSDWTQWRKNFFAKLPLGYRAGEFIFALSTVETYLETMADSNNNPIFRQATGLEVNDGDAVNPNGRFFGREVALVEPEILPDYDTASDGDVIGIFWQPEEYAINENFGFTMRRYFDDETNEWVDKALVVVDGKVLNPTGYYLIKKKV